MSSSREQRARNIHKLCELAARNAMPNLEDMNDPFVPEMLSAYAALATKLRYLCRRASAQWSASFDSVLSSSCCMRVDSVSEESRSRRRNRVDVCMACGNPERNCKYVIDLAGNMEADKWMSDAANLTPEYAKFVREYDTVFTKTFVNTKRGELPAIDKGSFVVGETCLRKAKLKFQVQTLLLETCYASERIVETMAQTDDLELNALYTITEERCEELVDQQDALDLAVADDKRPVPDILTDVGYWNNIDQARDRAAGHKEEVLDLLLYERAQQSIGAPAKKALMAVATASAGKKKKRSRDEDDDWLSGVSEEEGEELDDDEPERSGGRSHRRTTLSEEEEEEEGSVAKGLRTRLRAKGGKRRSVVVEEEPEEEPEEEQEEEQEEERLPSARVTPAPPTGRAAAPSASAMAGRLRQEGALGSRRTALLSLMQLQLELAQEGKHAQAAVCSNAIMTLQDTLERVERLAHTAGL